MENQDSAQIVGRLLQSFRDLETAIEGAKSNLKTNTKVPVSVMERLESYSDILDRQRELAKVLESHVNTGNLSEVARHITLINGLSGMIIDDAKGLLSGLVGEEIEGKEEIPFC